MAERESIDSLDSADLEDPGRDDLDDDFDTTTSPQVAHRSRIASNRNFEESSVEISDPDSMRDSFDSFQDEGRSGRKVDSPPRNVLSDPEAEYEDEEIDLRQAEKTERYGKEPTDSFDDNASENSDDDASLMRGNAISHDYDYSQLAVSSDLKELFEYIDRFKPSELELQTKLKPFIPEYIPGVGDVDAFIKVPAPGSKQDFLGLKVLDEPAARQTDPTVLEMQIRTLTKQANIQPMQVRGIENADKNSKQILAWVQKIQELHKSKPPPTVTYSKKMPDIESLMQEWPPEIEKTLEQAKLPSANLDVDLKTYARFVCAILDIPVHNNLVDSLHVLFTLFSAFKENQHFQNTSPS